MGLHGEHGVELMRSSIKKLEKQDQGTTLAELVQSHNEITSDLVQVSPTLHCLLQGLRKQKEKN